MSRAIGPGYLLGVGSNINPEYNIGCIIQSLLVSFPFLTISRALKIPPIGMNSRHDFLNMVVFITTEKSEPELKCICNDIETQLGRDRADPASKIKDRPADLDILYKVNSSDDLKVPSTDITDEYFLYPLLDEVCNYLLGNESCIKQEGSRVSIDDLSFGQTATTIYRNTAPCNERVV